MPGQITSGPFPRPREGALFFRGSADGGRRSRFCRGPNSGYKGRSIWRPNRSTMRTDHAHLNCAIAGWRSITRPRFLSARFCCSRCSRWSASTSCRGSAAVRPCGPRACCFFRRCCLAGYAYAHLSQQLAAAAAAGARAVGDHRGRAGAAARVAGRALEAARRQRSGRADSVDAGRHDRPAVLCAVADRAADAGVVCPLVSRPLPYRLYALSNVGSLLALLSYPLFFERVFDLRQQAGFWSWGFVAYARAVRDSGGATVDENRHVRSQSLPRRESESRDASLGRDSPPWQHVRLWLLSAGLRLRRAVGHDEPRLHRRRRDAAAVGRAAGALPADVHHRVRSPALVSADAVRRA